MSQIPDQRQSSFGGGEWSPTLEGRLDLDTYVRSLRRCYNFFPNQHGALLNRPGTRFLAEIKNSAQGARLIPFTFANGQTYVLEFGHLYLRFYRDGAQILSNGTVYEWVTPYTWAQVQRLKYSQLGNVITLCCRADTADPTGDPGQPPYELRRTGSGDTNWQLTQVVFTPPSFSAIFPDGTVAVSAKSLTDTDGDTRVFKKWTWWATALIRNYRGELIETAAVQVNAAFFTNGDDWSKFLQYQIGDVVRGSNGSYYTATEISIGKDPTLGSGWSLGGAADTTVKTRTFGGGASLLGEVVLYTDRPIKLYVVYGAASPQYPVEALRFYRGREDVKGYVGEVAHIISSFEDDGAMPDYTQVPPDGTNPFTVTVQDGTSTIENPAISICFEQRRVYANTPSHPNTIFFSPTGDFYNFTKAKVMTADQPFELMTAGMRFEEIRNLLPLRALLALSGEAEWLISGSAGSNDTLTAASFRARQQSYRGSSWLDPLSVGLTTLTVQAKGNTVRELVYDLMSDSYQGNDLTVMAKHLFYNHTIVSWAYAQEPFSIVWAVRDDGVLLGLTYLREEKLIAWHQHETDGAFESVCTVPEGTEDAVYVIVRRTVGGAPKRYVERFTSRILPPRGDGSPDVTKGVFLDASLTYQGDAQTVFHGLDHLEGRQVKVLADGNVLGPYTVSGGAISIATEMPDGASYVTAGLAYTSEGETHSLAVQGAPDSRSNKKSVYRVYFETVDSRGLWVGQDAAHMREWRMRQVSDSYGAVALFEGLDHVRVPNSYGHGARVFFQQRDPLPLTLLAIGREVDLGGG